jgi:O-acetylserine/cysteine efflux transporter
LLFLGLQLGMTAGMASVVMQTQAFFTLLLAAPLLGERARLAQWLGLTVALAGLVVIAAAHGDGPGEMTLIGFVLTLSAAFMWASSNIVVRFAVRNAPGYNPFSFIVWSSLFPIVPFALLALSLDGADKVMRQLAGLDLPAVLAVLFLAWFATLLAYTLWTRLLQRHPAGRVVPFSLLVPVVGLAAAAVCFGERPSPAQWAGTAAVLLGLMINQGIAVRAVAWLRAPRRA